MRLTYFILIVFASNFVFAQKNVSKSPRPSWVNEITYSNEAVYDENSGYQYLLVDFQDNFIEKASFKHFVIKLSNSNGIQSNSDITVAFDPAYQKLLFHEIRIIRDGQNIDKLNPENIQVIQRESSMERALYDGSLTAIINLTDVREQDIVEYSYTTIGFNPIYKGYVSNTFYHQFAIPVNHIYNRLITKKDECLEYKLYNETKVPLIKENHENKEYIWDLDGLDFKLFDDYVPSWIEIHKRVSFTTLKNWNEVVNWALPLYRVNMDAVKKIADSITKSKDKNQAATDIIRFVQDNIRYLGFEDGINAFKPNQPEKVFRQRYGDCKDKSLLLASLLRSVGFDAHPILVNTYLRHETINELPSINAFNHCIVSFKIGDKNYFVDPTISDQRGGLKNIPIPDYGYGLLIKAGEQALTPITQKSKPLIKINEVIKLDSINGNAAFSVTSNYTESKADGIRSYFNSNARDVIKKEYTDFYRNLYPRIEQAKDIQLLDSDTSTIDELTVKEEYFVKNIWENSATDNRIYCEIYPLVLETYIDYFKSANRETPYYMGEPFTYTQTSQVIMPEDWDNDDYEITIKGPGFKYDNEIFCTGRKIKIVHKFDLLKSSIPGDSIETFLSKIDEVKTEMHYYITYNPDRAGFKVSWISVLLAIISTLTTTGIAIYLYKNFNPAPKVPDTNQAIGGWMVLPLIGLCLTPFVISGQLFSQDFFNHNTWIGVYNKEAAVPISFLFILGGEIIFNFFLLVFAVFLIIIFFQRRTSLPIFISIFYTVMLIGSIADFAATKLILSSFLTEEDITESVKAISKAFVAAVIWIPYFQVSERVKDTFCKTRVKKPTMNEKQEILHT